MNKPLHSYIAFIILLAGLGVQAQTEKVDYQVISKIKDEAFNHSKVMDHLFNITDVSGPRLSGSTNLRNAQKWATGAFKEWGLENAKMEPWGGFGKGWEVKKSYAAMTFPYYQPIICIPKAWTPSTNGFVKSEVVLVKADKEDELEKYKGKLGGKIVVVYTNLDVKPGFNPDARRYTDEDLRNIYMDKVVEDNQEKRNTDNNQMRNNRLLRQKISALLLEENAAVVLSSRGGIMGTFYTTNGASYSTNAKQVLPELEIGSEHINQLIRLLEAGKNVEMEIEIKTEFNSKDTIEYNVIAEIPGTDKTLKSELVMIGAHLDSWHAATGATDNAAGSAVMMEVMRILKAIDVKPRRTIRVALWSAEEQGLIGSRAYVKEHFADPETMNLKPDHSKFSVYYNLDNGGGRIRGIYLQGNDALRPLFEALLEPFRDVNAITVTSKNTGSTDHISFDQVGLPGFQFIQDPMDYGNKTHHTNMDTYDRVMKGDMMQASAIIASLVYHSAMRDEKIARKPMPKAKEKTLK